MVIDSQISFEHNNKKWKANSEPRTLPTNGIFNCSFEFLSLILTIYLIITDACLDHFRIDKEQSMLADCQTLFERNEPLDKPDRHGITLVKKKRKSLITYSFLSL